MERELARVEADRASQEWSDEDVNRILRQMQSPDAQARAAAVRSSCPCHVPWHVFDRLRKPAQRLRKDPSPEVRALALHLEEDARLVANFEADLDRAADREDDLADYASRSRRRPKPARGRHS